MKEKVSYELIDWLQQRLNKPLLGLGAQKLMAPESRKFKPDTDRELISSAVLILLYPNEYGQWTFPLIRRPEYNGTHSGQMALPGGKFEQIDSDLVQTALRETEEEIGVDQGSVEVLGSLSELYIPVSNIKVQPVVGYIKQKPLFVPDLYEVDEIFTVTLSDFLNPELKKQEQWNYKGLDMQVPFYFLREQKVWGATAMILSELEQILTDFSS